MKPYGYKKLRKPPGDGCPLCLKGLSVRSKSSKSANRGEVRKEIQRQLDDDKPCDNESHCSAWCKHCV